MLLLFLPSCIALSTTIPFFPIHLSPRSEAYCFNCNISDFPVQTYLHVASHETLRVFLSEASEGPPRVVNHSDVYGTPCLLLRDKEELLKPSIITQQQKP